MQEEIRKLYNEEKLTLEDTAKQVGKSRRTVSRTLKKLGISPRPPAYYLTKITAEEKEVIVRRYLAGESSKDLGRAFNVHPSNIARYVREAGEEPRGVLFEKKVNEKAFDCLLTGRRNPPAEYWLGRCMSPVFCSVETPMASEARLVFKAYPDILAYLKSFLRAANSSVLNPTTARVVSTSLVTTLYELGVRARSRSVEVSLRDSLHLWKGVVDSLGRFEDDRLHLEANPGILVCLGLTIRDLGVSPVLIDNTTLVVDSPEATGAFLAKLPPRPWE
jgi:transposase-like protein